MALVPAVVKKLVARKIDITIQSNAGSGSHHIDDDYISVGASIAQNDEAQSLWAEADIVLTVHPPTPQQAGAMRQGAIFVGVLDPVHQHDVVQAMLDRKVTAFAMTFVPRTTRAQSMDILSSQANLGGYRAALMAAAHSAKLFPMMMTAAGMIKPAKVFIIGAGVAGLQAIATAKRLGAIVEAFDVRPAVEEQIKSLGARFVKIDLGADDSETAGGYAKELTEEQRQKQTELMQKHIIGSNCTITTAAVFGKAPPMLISKSVVEQMPSGAVIIDLAANPEYGRGNCELTEPGKCITTDNGVIIDGSTNLPSTVAIDASGTFANNLVSFLDEIIKETTTETDEGEDKKTETSLDIELNLEDEIQKGACITHAGQLTNDLVRSAMGKE